MILLILIIANCQTTEKRSNDNLVLPAKPERQELSVDISCIELIVYYEYLLQEWELWGDTIENIIKVE